MTPSIALVLAVLVLVIILFVTDAVRVDVVGLLMMVLLPLLGLVTPQQAIGGLGSSAVVSIIGVIILGAGMEKTGAMRALSRVILKYAGKSEQRVVILIASSVATISAFMQNIGAAALFLPAARRISRQTGIPCSRILLPMAYCAIIGGCLTMVGSSPLIMLNDIMTLDGEKLAPFSMFSVTPIGLCLVGAALLYFGLLGKYILPPAAGQDQSGPLSGLLDKTYHDVGGLFEMRVPKYFTGAVPLSALGLRPSYYTSVVAICRNGTGKHIIGPVADDELHPGDHIAVVGPRHFVETLACDLCWELLPELFTFAEILVGFGDAMTLVSAVFYALHITLVSKFAKERSIYVLTIWQFFAVALCSFIVALALEAPPDFSSFPTEAWPSILYLSVIVTALALLFQNIGQAHLPPASAALLLSLESVFGVLFSIALGAEALTLRVAGGFVLVFAAIVVSEAFPELFRKRQERHERQERIEAEAQTRSEG